MKDFFTGLGTEFKKIVWPDTQEATGHAILVIIVAIAVGYYLGAFDALFAWVLKFIIK